MVPSAGAPDQATLVFVNTVATVTQRPDKSGIRSVAALAARPAVRECIQWFTEERRWINDRHLELCRIPAPTFQENRRAEWMAARFREIGCDVRIDRAGNVVSFLHSNQQTSCVALTAHLDTVLEPRKPEDITLGSDGKFRGPGVADNGAGLAALLAIAQGIRGTSLSGDLFPFVFLANVGEEGEGNLSGMRYICRPGGLGSRISSFVVLDGPNLDHITCRALASRRFEITLTGPGGHSWSDYGTGNPVHALSRAITLFSDLPLLNAPGPRSSFNFGFVEAGTSVNAIPAVARAKVDLRSEDAARLDELASLLTSSVERAIEVENLRASSGRIAAKIREIGSRPGGKLDDSAAIISHIRTVDAYLKIRSQLDCASTDANIPLSLGMQAVSVGAGGRGGGAHTAQEWYNPEGRELGLQRILLTLCLLAGLG